MKKDNMQRGIGELPQIRSNLRHRQRTVDCAFGVSMGPSPSTPRSTQTTCIAQLLIEDGLDGLRYSVFLACLLPSCYSWQKAN